MRAAMSQVNLLARAYHRIQKLTRTIAVLARSKQIRSLADKMRSMLQLNLLTRSTAAYQRAMGMLYSDRWLKEGKPTDSPLFTQEVEADVSKLAELQKLVKRDPVQRFAALNVLFRDGTPPMPPLNGRYGGELIALELAPGLTGLFQSITAAWMPWLGKTFNASEQRGDNIFTRDSYMLARLFNPFYHGFTTDQQGTYRCFAFRIHIAPGLMDTDRTVLKIDYDLKDNPALTVRRILDELVQIDEDLYLGKAHVRWWGGWGTVAFPVIS